MADPLPDGAPLEAASTQSPIPAWMWPAMMIVIIAAGLALGAVALYDWRSTGDTSVISQHDVSQIPPSPVGAASPSGAAASAAPAAAATPSSAAPTPQTTVSDKVTTTRTIPSDGVIGTMLGLATILILTGALLPRVTKIVLPGGGEIDAAPLAAAAAAAVTRQAPAAASAGRGRARAAAAGTSTSSAASGATAAAATALTLTRAQRLLADPKNVGRQLGLFDDQIAQARRRIISDSVWNRLAAQSLKDVQPDE